MTVIDRPAPSRGADIGLWTLQVLLAAVFAFSAYPKLTATRVLLVAPRPGFLG
jgi:hypothetical protein